MEEVFIDIRKESSWIRELFIDKDYVSISDLLGTIEDLIGDKERLEDKIKELENKIMEVNGYGEIL